MIKILTASYARNTGCTALARQIAKYCAAGDNTVTLVTESGLYDKIEEKDPEITVVSSEDRIPEETQIAVLDYSESSTKVIPACDKIYLVIDAGKISAAKLEKCLAGTSFDCELVLYGTNDMSDYKQLVPKVVKVADIEPGECQYEIRINLELFAHQRGFNVPPSSEDFEYDPIETGSQDEEPVKEKSNSSGLGGLISVFSRKKDNADDDDEEDDTGDREDYTAGHGKIEYEDDGSFSSKLADFKDKMADSAAGAVGALAASIKESSQKRKEKKAEENSKEKENDSKDKQDKKEKKDKNNDDEDIKPENRTDWAKKIKGIDAKAKATNQIFSVINTVLIISVVLMCVFTFVAFRNSKHKMVSLKELSKTEFPVKVETDGVSVTPYSGFAKNKKVAVVIGDDSFVKPYSKTYQKLENKEAVETRKYEITVTYTDNPLLQQMFGTLTFVHHSAFGEGEFSKKEIAQIMDYSSKWFSKKRYDLLRFNDRDTINVNDPPDSLVRYVGKDD